MGAQLRITGLDEARRLLRRLATPGPRVLGPALEAAAAPLAGAIRANSPRSKVDIDPVRPRQRETVTVAVVVTDEATYTQRRAVSRAYYSTRPAVKQVGERALLRALEREAQR